MQENDKVLILIGSADKLNERNPIPVYFREQLVREALISNLLEQEMNKIIIHKLPDLSDETDNSHDWGILFIFKYCRIN